MSLTGRLPDRLRRRIAILGALAAILTAVSVPVGYGWVSYNHAMDALAFQARIDAGRIARYVYVHDKLWAFQQVRLAELIEIKPNDSQIRQRVYTSSGRQVLEQGPQLPGLRLKRTAPINVSGVDVGWIEVETSAWPLIQRLANVAVASLLLGLLIVLVLRTLPLRLLDRTFAVLAERDEEIRAQNLRFEAALENMPQGLCMFDADQRLMVCNSHYARMFALEPEQTVPGTPLDAILEQCAAAGVYPKELSTDIESVIGKEQNSKPHHVVNEFSDGRVLSSAYQPMEGGAWVAIHQDITEQKRAEKKIAHMAHHDALTDLPNRTLMREKLVHQAPLRRAR